MIVDHRPIRRRVPAVVAASATPYCALCAGGARVALVGPAGIELPLAGCPHCSPGTGAAPLPILAVPPRPETPRRTS